MNKGFEIVICGFGLFVGGSIIKNLFNSTLRSTKSAVADIKHLESYTKYYTEQADRMKSNSYVSREYMEKAIGCESNASEIKQWTHRNILVRMFTMSPHMDFMKIERTAFQRASNQF